MLYIFKLYFILFSNGVLTNINKVMALDLSSHIFDLCTHNILLFSANLIYSKLNNS